MRRRIWLGGVGVILLGAAPVANAGLELTALGKTYSPDPNRVPISQSAFDTGGSTSARNSDELVWKEAGYFQRNRDLGQVFTPKTTFQLEAIVLRTGPSASAIFAGTPGADMFLQFFEVEGTPRIHDNGTPPGTAAKHGFTPNHRADDYIEGVTYRSLRVVTGGVFPDLPPTKKTEAAATNDTTGQLHYLRWKLTGDDRLTFEAGKRYAFMVGFTTPKPGQSFTLANSNSAGDAGPPVLDDRSNRYPGGWGLRREGDGTLPPTMHPGRAAPTDSAQRDKLTRESVFADGEARFQLSPTTDGYPDVDTYRDLEFYLETVAR